MSTPEVLEDTVDPLKIVDDFKASNTALIEQGVSLYNNPSSQGMVDLDQLSSRCKQSAQPIEDGNFFADFGNELYVAYAIEGLIEAGRELAVSATEIRDDIEVETYKEGFETFLDDALTSEDPIDVPEAFIILDGPSQVTRAQIISEVFINFRLMVDQFEAAVLSSESVSIHVDTLKDNIDKKKARKRAFKLYGGVVLASFAGTFLANGYNKRA